MRKFLFLLSLVLLFQSFDIRQALKDDPTVASVNTRCYQFFQDALMSAAPKGYKPFYISQYARHGARFDGSTTNCERVLKYLDTASAHGLLTPAGDSLYAEVKAILEMSKGHEGALLPAGQREHEQLASRLYERYGEVFRNGAQRGQSVRVKCTTSHRVLLSMAAYTNQLTRYVPELRYEMTAAPVDGSIISNGPSDTHRTAARELRAKVLESPHDYSYLMNRLFTDPEQASKLIKPSSLEMCLFQVARFSKPLERPIDLYDYLSEDAIYRFWRFTSSELYLYNANSVEFGKERMPRCQALVDIILDNAKDAIENSSVCADLFFGHDYPILALASRFHIEEVGGTMSAAEIESRWTDPTNISFASNLQMIFFRNKSGSILVKFIYNDRERKLTGITPYQGCYYRWEDVQKFRSL